MKKSLIALAVLGAFTGAAAAQSSATLYGLLDVGYAVGNNGAYETSQGNESKFQQWGNANSTSRWGLKGQEDLGNGTAVYFNLESGFQPETGSGKSRLFDRAAYVGIKGAFGAVQAGRQTTVMNNVLGRYDASGTTNTTSSLGNVGISAVSQRLGFDATKGRNYGNNYSRVDSAIAYVSPKFAGFGFQAAFVTKNDDIFGAGANAKNIYTVGANYENGPFSIGAAYESKPVDIPGGDISGSWGIGAKVDFGMVAVNAGYTDNHLKADGKGFYLGATMPVNAFTFGAQVAVNTDAYGAHKDGVSDDDAWGWELFAKYKLSPRTSLYAQYGGIDSSAERFMGARRDYSAAFGIIHKF